MKRQIAKRMQGCLHVMHMFKHTKERKKENLLA